MIRSAITIAAMLMTTAAFAQAEPAGQTVEVNGMQMYYEVSGEGDPLVVLHGAYMNIQAMGAIIPRLAETHKVYALEFQGHGRTTDIDRPITYPNLAGDVAALRLAIDHPAKVDQLVTASVGYDTSGWQPAFTAFIPQMTPEMFVGTPMEDEWKKLAPNPGGFRAVVEKLIALEHEPMAWEAEVKALKAPVLIIAGDADVSTLEHNVAMFRLLGGGQMGDMGAPLSPSRLAILPATSHTAVINQVDLLHGFIEPFLQGETPAGFMGQ
jgi:pimeloyl-ACP methyl ester carboxylesterase